MKKLFSILFLFTLIIVSCEKSPDSPTIKAPTEITKVSDLEGTWICQKFHSPNEGDVTPDDCPYMYTVPGNNPTIPLPVLLSFKIVGTKCTVTDECGQMPDKDYTITLYNKRILLNDIIKVGYSGLTIESYNAPILVLKWMFSTGTSTQAVPTYLTLKKTS